MDQDVLKSNPSVGLSKHYREISRCNTPPRLLHLHLSPSAPPILPTHTSSNSPSRLHTNRHVHMLSPPQGISLDPAFCDGLGHPVGVCIIMERADTDLSAFVAKNRIAGRHDQKQLLIILVKVVSQFRPDTKPLDTPCDSEANRALTLVGAEFERRERMLVRSC